MEKKQLYFKDFLLLLMHKVNLLRQHYPAGGYDGLGLIPGETESFSLWSFCVQGFITALQQSLKWQICQSHIKKISENHIADCETGIIINKNCEYGGANVPQQL